MLSLRTAFNHYLFLADLFPRNRFFGGLADNKDYPAVTELDWVSGACLIIRRSVLKNVGLLDESIFMYNEDMELCYRVRQAGYRVIYVPSARVKHFVSQSMQQQTVGSILAGPLYSQDALYRRLYGQKWLFLFRLVVWVGTLLRLVFRLVFIALRSDNHSRYRLHEAKRNATAAWRLLKNDRRSVG